MYRDPCKVLHRFSTGYLLGPTHSQTGHSSLKGDGECIYCVILPHMRRAQGFCLSWYTPFLNNVGFMRKKEINKNAYVCDVQKLLHGTPCPLTSLINLMRDNDFGNDQTLKASQEFILTLVTLDLPFT